jgi:hypothetical protein
MSTPHDAALVLRYQMGDDSQSLVKLDATMSLDLARLNKRLLVSDGRAAWPCEVHDFVAFEIGRRFSQRDLPISSKDSYGTSSTTRAFRRSAWTVGAFGAGARSCSASGSML